VENVQIFTKFSGHVQEEMSIPPANKLVIFATSDIMSTSYFCVCILWILLLKTDIDKMLKQTNWSLCWQNPKIC